MFSATNIYPVLIALHIIEAVLVALIFRDKHDKSAQLWVGASLMFAVAISVLCFFNETASFERDFLGNFLTAYTIVLYVYSLFALFDIPQNTKILDAAICTVVATVFFLLVELDLTNLVAPMAGLLYGLINALAYFRLKRANRNASNTYLQIISYTFLAVAVIWFIRIPLSQRYGLKFAVDAGMANYVLVFSTFIFLVIRQVGYLILRINLMLNAKIHHAAEFAAATQTQMLKSLNAISRARDNETGSHIVRTQWYVKEVALQLMATGHYTDQLSKEIIETMFNVAPLHDIGKVGIPDSILLKPGALDPEEWTIMKTHTTIGETILRAAIDGNAKHTQLLQMGIEIAGEHHEKWNGKGYPRGLSGQQIRLSARIMSVADMYDALVSVRVYKEKWSHAQAIEEIKRNSGESFDPVVVEAFLSIQEKIKSIATANADED